MYLLLDDSDGGRRRVVGDPFDEVARLFDDLRAIAAKSRENERPTD